MKLRDRLRRRWHGIEPPPEPEAPRWLHNESWTGPQTGGGFEPDGHELREAVRRRHRVPPRPEVRLADPEEMAAAGWRMDQHRRNGRLE
jgi:hypothetical protein